MARCHLKTLKWSKNRIKNRDIFRQTVSLTFKNNDSYSTIVGGLLTILIFIFLLIYGVILLVSMFKKSQVSWNRNTYWRDINGEVVSHNITADDPQIVFNWETYHNFEIEEDVSAANFIHQTFEHKTVDLENDIQKDVNITDFE